MFSAQEPSDNEMSRSLVSIYEQEDYSKESMICCVEKCMKKYVDEVLLYLEGISGRLAQLEIHCYKLERSVGEFRADFIQDRSDNDLKFKSVEKHIQEVGRMLIPYDICGSYIVSLYPTKYKTIQMKVVI